MLYTINLQLKKGLKLNNSGFTLAEVLITLGIIGVVSAMTIPNLIANNKAQKLRSQFLKSYSVVQQVFKQMEADDVSLNPADYKPNTTGKFYKTFIKYFSLSTAITLLAFILTPTFPPPQK